MDGGSKSVKGTVTSLSSLFSPEEAKSAARRVEEAIAERRNELDRVQSFVEENSSLVKLVQRLPDQLHHDIMVPFGKGAFFPGKLVHTNEFLVLLGEGYYADSTSKQTVEILNRRGKELESQVESLKAMIKDLKAEASFFDDTAAEAAEGLVEIMEEEDCVHDIQDEEAILEASIQVAPGLFENENNIRSETDEEYARMMARLDELEEAEMAAESENGDSERLVSGNEAGKAESSEVSNRHNTGTADEMKGNDFHKTESLKSKFNQIRPRNEVSHDLASSERFQCEKTAYEIFCHGDQNSEDKLRSSKMQNHGSAAKLAPRGEILLRKDLTQGSSSNSISKNISGALNANENPRERSSEETARAHPPAPTFDSQKARAQPPTPASDSLKAFTCSIVEHTHNLEPKNNVTSGQARAQPPAPSFDSQKAFTGSIVERSYNLEPKNNVTSAQSASSLPSKPVSRFKMERK